MGLREGEGAAVTTIASTLMIGLTKVCAATYGTFHRNNFSPFFNLPKHSASSCGMIVGRGREIGLSHRRWHSTMPIAVFFDWAVFTLAHTDVWHFNTPLKNGEQNWI
jgi:hypothetical protein